MFNSSTTSVHRFFQRKLPIENIAFPMTDGFALPIKRPVFHGKTVGFLGEMAGIRGLKAVKKGRFRAKFRAGAANSREFLT